MVETQVAVTGATGFIGRHVAAELERRSVPATLASRSPVESATARTVTFDLADPPARPFDALGRPDVVVHLAWNGLPNYGSEHHLTEELPRHQRLLAALVEGGLQNLVVAGTCLEYGMQSGCLREDMSAEPVVPYAQAKDLLRRGLEQLRERVPYNLTWARLFYTFGSGQAPSSLYSQLAAAAATGAASFDMSGGEQLRDYLPVAKVASILVELALLGEDVGIVNVCSGHPVSVVDQVNRWIEANGWDIEPRLGVHPYPSYEPMAFWGDPARLCELLGR
jgi:nucleoside-diphosphate-sugar epimerase